MKPTNKMTLDELLQEKELIEKKEKRTSQDKARLKKLQNEINKSSNKLTIVDSFTNESMQNDLKLQYIYIKDIVMPEYDDRSGIDKEKINTLATSIKDHGLIQYPVLKDLGNGSFEKKVGRRRILASKLNGEEKILAKVLPVGLTEEQEDFIIWDENNQREDLNLYDKVRFHLRFICRRFNLSDEKEAIKLINNCHYYKKNDESIVTKENKQKVIELEELLVQLGSYKVVSSLMNNLQVLNFESFIIEAMKESKISYKLAYLLNKSIIPLNDIYNSSDVVKKELQFIIESEYSVTEAEKYINKIIKNNIIKDEVEIKFEKTVKKLNRKLNKTSPEDREKVIKSIYDLLKSL